MVGFPNVVIMVQCSVPHHVLIVSALTFTDLFNLGSAYCDPVMSVLIYFSLLFRQTFATLQDLVTGYQSAACKGLCCQLTKPCQKPQPREGRSNALEYATRDQYEIPRSQITLTKKLGKILFIMFHLQ